MKTIISFLSREKVAILFFILYFLIGISVIKDYSVSWDEFYQEGIGHTNLQYVLKKSNLLLSPAYPDKYFGPAYELIIAVTRLCASRFNSSLTHMGQAFTLFRHAVNFITFFFGVLFFYLLCRHRFKSTCVALLGATLLILTPRLFADAYYNSKDTVFLAFFVMSFYALVKFLEKKTVLRLILLAIITGISCSIRIASLLVPLFALLLFLGDRWLAKDLGIRLKKDVIFLLGYGGITAITIFVTYPILWTNPIHNFLYILQVFSHFTLEVQNLYFGRYIVAQKIPWHYIPVWISITTPPLYLALFLAGLVSLWLRLKRDARQFYIRYREDVLFLLWFFFPLTTVMLFRTPQFNAWRHMFFIYPAFLLIALHGVLYIKTFIQRHFNNTYLPMLGLVLLFANLVYIGKTMIDLHPFEHLYFNFLAGPDMKTIRKNFETDYWGLTYRKGLEFLLRYDKSNQIVAIADYPGWSNQWILSDKDRARVYVGLPWDIGGPKPKYFMTNFFFSQKEFPYTEIYAVNVKGADILKVYELPDSANISFDGKFIYR